MFSSFDLFIFFGVVAGAAGGGVNVKEQAMQGGGGCVE
jgi:hypothetical protein